MNSRWLTLVILLLAGAGLAGCDFFRKSKCEWYLVPEPKHKHLVEDGWVSLCARNYTLNRQKCYLMAKYNFAEKLVDKPFRMTTLELDESTFPRKIVSLQVCEPEPPKE